MVAKIPSKESSNSGKLPFKATKTATPKVAVAKKASSKEAAAKASAIKASKSTGTSSRKAATRSSNTAAMLPLQATQDSAPPPPVVQKAKQPAKNKKPAAVPETQWRASALAGSKQTITASNAQKQYRVSSRELKELSYTEQRSKNHQEGYNAMHLYQEVDVERIAWKKHGGPDGWKWHLDNLFERHRKKFNTWKANGEQGKRPEFQEPDLYLAPGSVAIVSLRPLLLTEDEQRELKRSGTPDNDTDDTDEDEDCDYRDGEYDLERAYDREQDEYWMDQSFE
ncbi:hypothetical protein FA95DRAFT_1599194 [Auriscalpium vulgare]|uniref:Uncharacterized protein n=1 Tax=Auriscalpium vulgare TaxID=40419 RepID=A0ACB8RBL0_9AGAM|nr:hypothetical protein FA95DRAFT_1599194 [Auriscalpium vulgare]